MEPALIAIVALIIIGRAVLRSSGGDTDRRAAFAEWTALTLSLALNIIGGWPSNAGFWAELATALPHAIGPLGCAGTAFLIGLFSDYVAAAKPWADAPPAGRCGTGAAGTGEHHNRHPSGTGGAGTESVRGPVALTAVPVRCGGTGPGRMRPVPASGTSGRRAISAHAGTGAVPSERSPKVIAREFWDAKMADGRQPSGMDLARAAGKDNDDSGIFRRYAREFAGPAALGDSGAATS